VHNFNKLGAGGSIASTQFLHSVLVWPIVISFGKLALPETS